MILIDMKMPKCCRTCHISNTDFCGFFCPIISWRPIVDSFIHKRHDQCPLIELPPHGRLIDADALYEQAENIAENYCGFFNDMENVISARDIELAPTIIPASKEET